MMDKKVSSEPKKLESAIVFADSAVDTAADNIMLVTDVELRTNVDKKKLAKDEKRRLKKLEDKAAADAAAEENVDRTLTKDRLQKNHFNANLDSTKLSSNSK